MIDFSISPELEATRQRTTALMDEFVYANESRMVEDEGLPADLELELQKKVKALGLGRRISPAVPVKTLTLDSATELAVNDSE